MQTGKKRKSNSKPKLRKGTYSVSCLTVQCNLTKTGLIRRRHVHVSDLQVHDLARAPFFHSRISLAFSPHAANAINQDPLGQIESIQISVVDGLSQELGYELACIDEVNMATSTNRRASIEENEDDAAGDDGDEEDDSEHDEDDDIGDVSNVRSSVKASHKKISGILLLISGIDAASAVKVDNYRLAGMIHGIGPQTIPGSADEPGDQLWLVLPEGNITFYLQGNPLQIQCAVSKTGRVSINQVRKNRENPAAYQPERSSTFSFFTAVWPELGLGN